MPLRKPIAKTLRGPARRRFLHRLGRDTAGNVLAITAAAVVPMIGVVGGAIDASRLYMVRSRLQAACDSAVLAGRKAMTSTTYSTAASDRANAMFNFNFKNADYQTTGTSFVAQADASGKLSATAVTAIPMTLMKVFGFGSVTSNVNCSADIQIPNIDIVFVLDVTGSMAQSLGTTTRILALKSAAKSFYQTLATQMAANGTNAGQVRYGFVPYDQNVRVTDLFKASPDTTLGEAPLSHLSDTMIVQSRVANMTTSTGGSGGEWVVDTSVSPTVYTQQYRGDQAAARQPYAGVTGGNYKMSNNDCGWYSTNKSFNISANSGGGTDVILFPNTSYPGQGNGTSILYIPQGGTVAQTSQPTSGTSFVRITFSRKSGTWEDDDGSDISDYQKCERYVTHTTYKKSASGFRFTNWTYKPITVNVSSYKTGAALRYIGSLNSDYDVDVSGSYDPIQLAALADQTGLSASTSTWNGCIEERDTVAESSFSPIPAGALDLNWLLPGTTDATKWRPVLRDMTYDRERVAERTTTNFYGKPATSCPDASVRNLRPYPDALQFNSYIDSLEPGGNTYLDVGMIWGLRLIAPQGMFGYRNLIGPNGGQISRHIIFLTDGDPVSRGDIYSAYGVEDMAARITGTTGVSAATLHAARFQALCNGMRGTVSIWAIALDTSVNSNLSSCADPGRAYQANNSTQLNAAFQNIARDIADLRLVQ